MTPAAEVGRREGLPGVRPRATTGAVDGAADSRWVDSMPDVYDRFLGPSLFRPFARDLARRVADLRPTRVLELAAASGRRVDFALLQRLSELAEPELIAAVKELIAAQLLVED